MQTDDGGEIVPGRVTAHERKQRKKQEAIEKMRTFLGKLYARYRSRSQDTANTDDTSSGSETIGPVGKDSNTQRQSLRERSIAKYMARKRAVLETIRVSWPSRLSRLQQLIDTPGWLDRLARPVDHPCAPGPGQQPPQPQHQQALPHQQQQPVVTGQTQAFPPREYISRAEVWFPPTIRGYAVDGQQPLLAQDRTLQQPSAAPNQSLQQRSGPNPQQRFPTPNLNLQQALPPHNDHPLQWPLSRDDWWVSAAGHGVEWPQQQQQIW